MGSRNNSPEHIMNDVVRVNSDFERNTTFIMDLGELKPRYSYVFQVYAVIHDSDEKGAINQLFLEYPSGSKQIFKVETVLFLK